MTERDWRETAYLRKENYPEAIPWTAPKREYGPYPWGQKVHNDPHDLDDYPHSNPSAGSVSETHLGDVCPYCGVPLDWVDDEVVMWDGRKGLFCEVNEVDNPKPAYHPECWKDRQAEKHRLENQTLDQYA